jgi:hypothetical protein
MLSDRQIDRLMDKLLRSIEVSLRATEASREAIREILRRGAETSIFFAARVGQIGDAGRATGPTESRAAGASPGDVAFDLTQQDRDFLRSLSIRPDSR